MPGNLDPGWREQNTPWRCFGCLAYFLVVSLWKHTEINLAGVQHLRAVKQTPCGVPSQKLNQSHFWPFLLEIIHGNGPTGSQVIRRTQDVKNSVLKIMMPIHEYK